MFSAVYAGTGNPNSAQVKSGLSPTGVLRQSWHYDTTVFITNYTLPKWKTQTARSRKKAVSICRKRDHMRANDGRLMARIYLLQSGQMPEVTLPRDRPSAKLLDDAIFPRPSRDRIGLRRLPRACIPWVSLLA
jgi:hypothetical protein